MPAIHTGDQTTDCEHCQTIAAREWLLDISPDEDSDNTINEESAEWLKLTVERHYAGGWSAFVADAG